jgi:hypothetical protein
MPQLLIPGFSESFSARTIITGYRGCLRREHGVCFPSSRKKGVCYYEVISGNSVQHSIPIVNRSDAEKVARWIEEGIIPETIVARIKMF